MQIPSLNMKLPLKLGRQAGADVVGLDIQPGFVAAVRASVNGSIVPEQAAALPLPGDAVRDGEVMDETVLSDVLRELFSTSGLSKRVRIGVANQRTVLRTLELPPVTDQKELAAAVTFQAQDQVPMPLSNAVMDFHPLGIVDTPSGPRQRVVLVAAQRDMIERLLGAVRNAGLSPEGVDLSAFALIRSLYRREPEPNPGQTSRVLYLNVDGLTNLAIAEGTVCRFTRVVGSGLEGMAGELAERRSIALADARELLAGVDLTAPAPTEQAIDAPETEAPQLSPEDAPSSTEEGLSPEEVEESERGMSYEEMSAIETAAESPMPSADGDLRTVLENGIRDISGEVRNSLDFHRSQDGGGEVSHIVLSGSVRDIPGFAEALQTSLGVEVRCEDLAQPEGGLVANVSSHRLAVATGLASAEIPQ